MEARYLRFQALPLLLMGAFALGWLVCGDLHSCADLRVEVADLVCVGRVTDTKTFMEKPNDAVSDELRWTTVTVTSVLKGDGGINRKQITVREVIPSFGPPPTSWFASRRGGYYLAAFRQEGIWYAPAMSGAYEVTSRTIGFPPDAPLSEKINLVLLATLRDCADKPQLVPAAFRGLREQGASLDSPYYDLLSEYRRLERHPLQSVQAEALYSLLLLGDDGALAHALELARTGGALGDRLPDLLQRFGEDAVTTLCLIAEGKFLKKAESDALRVLREMKSPYALPTLIRCLDNPDGGVQYMAYSAIERTITKGQRMSSVDEFLGLTPSNGIREFKFNPLPPHSVMLVEKMKQWWEAEGKRQFDYVLPKEK